MTYYMKLVAPPKITMRFSPDLIDAFAKAQEVTMRLQSVDSTMVAIYDELQDLACRHLNPRLILVSPPVWFSMLRSNDTGLRHYAGCYFYDVETLPDSTMTTPFRIICTPRDEERRFMTECTRGHADCLAHPELARACQKEYIESL